MANENITALADQLFRIMENGLVIRAFVRPHPASGGTDCLVSINTCGKHPDRIVELTGYFIASESYNDIPPGYGLQARVLSRGSFVGEMESWDEETLKPEQVMFFQGYNHTSKLDQMPTTDARFQVALNATCGAFVLRRAELKIHSEHLLVLAARITALFG